MKMNMIGVTYKGTTDTIKIPKRYLEMIKIMDNAGVFALKSGKATIHKDADGNLRKVEIDQITYKS